MRLAPPPERCAPLLRGEIREAEGASSIGLPAVVQARLQALRRCQPELADRARRRLGLVLRPVLATAWPEIALGFSRLTNTGMPLEFAWSSRETALRWTAEVAAPEAPDAGRLRRAAELAGPGLDPGPWAALQAGAALRYGAWLGGRHRGDGDAAKVYVELPGGRLPPAWRGRHPLLRSPLPAWRMAGLGPDGGVEFYARVQEVDATLLHATAAASVGHGDAWLDTIAALTGQRVLPRPSGLSVAFDAGGTPRGLTWFVFAKALFRDDEAAAAALRRHAGTPSARALLEALEARVEAAGAEESITGLPRASGRAAASAASTASSKARWRHGMIGVGLDAAGATWVQAGLRP